METNLKFDGLVVKANFDSELKCKTNFSDCALCCLDCTSCKDCPLRNGFYFAQVSESSSMSSDDKSKLSSIIQDLKTITSRLEVNLSLGSVFESTISMAKSYLYCSLSDLDSIKTFDN